MKYHRLFLRITKIKKSNSITLTKEQFHYLKNVMRIQDGEVFRIFNGIDGEWEAKLFNKSAIPSNKIVEQTQHSDIKINLCFAIVKNKAMKNIIRQSTELGVTTIQPMQTKHSIQEKHNIDKLEIHAIEAAEQCERLTVPRILPAINFYDIFERYKNIILCNERSEYKRIKIPKFDSYTIAIGPEGGFSAEEVEHAKNKCINISLGKNILRCDTAACSAISYLEYYLLNLNSIVISC